MNALLEFLRAAAPWVAVGLAAAVLAVRRGRAKKKKDKSGGDNCSVEGMCFGMALGTALGAALGDDHTGIGTSLGMLIGLAVGMCIPKEKEG